jgi:hypothetical protein
LRTWGWPGAHKLTIFYPSQLPFYLVCWVAKRRVQQELISTKMPLVATLKCVSLFSCTDYVWICLSIFLYFICFCQWICRHRSL